jgi:hypothetical protein
MESVHQAEQLYVFASIILGPAPERVRLPAQAPETASAGIRNTERGREARSRGMGNPSRQDARGAFRRR